MTNDKTIKIRVPESDLENWKKAAENTGVSLSEYIRSLLNMGEIQDAVQVDKAAPYKKQTVKLKKDTPLCAVQNDTGPLLSTSDLCQVVFCGHKRWEHKRKFCTHGDCRCGGFE